VSFELTILGSSSALPTSKRFPTAHLLQVDERFFLIDCGEGTQVQLRRFGYNPVRIHHIFISHLHGDHVFGLFGLLSTMGMLGRKAMLHLYGPAALGDLLRQHLGFFGSLPYEYLCHVPENEAGAIIFADAKLEVRSIPLKHRTETYAYLFREKARPLNLRKEMIPRYKLGIEDMARIKEGRDHVLGDGRIIPNHELTLPPFHRRSYAYVSDTVYDPAIAEEIASVDLLFHEATFASRDEKLARETLHSTAAQAATIAGKAGAGKLLIGHFSSRYKDSSLLLHEAQAIFPHTEAVQDGDKHSLPLERSERE
jgi:ribonuclease Z